MRSAVSRFIECISFTCLSLTEKIKRGLLDTLNENLRHPNSQIQVLSIDLSFYVLFTYFKTNLLMFSFPNAMYRMLLLKL